MAKERGNDRVPTWDNDPGSFNEFEERCSWYERGLSERDKPMAVARIVQRLSGDTWKAIEGLGEEDRGKLCKLGVATLTSFLRDAILEAGVPEMGKRFGEYLGRFHRKMGETMRAYVQSHRLLQTKVETALAKVDQNALQKTKEIGRASCRERV